MPLSYEQLLPGEIRLLRAVHAPVQNGPIRFTLEVFPLNWAPTFCAFSYIWGDPKRTSPIVVNGHMFEATENLVSALSTHVRTIQKLHDDSPIIQAQYIWADAVCINQQDYWERSSQVGNMGEIYRKGIVCIYLNTSDHDVFKAVKRILDALSKNDSPLLDDISKDTWLDILHFFSKEWFHRMWVIQEFVLANSRPLILFLGGLALIGASDLRSVAWEVLQHDPKSLGSNERHTLRNSLSQYLALTEIKYRAENYLDFFFFTLLWVFRDRQVTDPRDKIYSLLGLLPVADFYMENPWDSEDTVIPGARGFARQFLVVNYETALEDVYASAVKATVIGSQSLNVICACQRPGKFSRSWVPDWSEPWSKHSLLARSLDIVPEHLSKSRFKASHPRVLSGHFSQDLQTIVTEGIRCSTVAVLGIWPKDQLSTPWAREWFDSVPIEYRQRLGTTYGVNDDEIWGMFAMSLCAPNAQDEFEKTEAMASEIALPYLGASVEWRNIVEIFKQHITEPDPDISIVDVRITQMLDGRKVFIGENGYCGLVPDHTEPGDIICVLFGCDVPVVLRKAGQEYTFIGECYVRGIMYGEAVEAFYQKNLTAEHFTLR